MQITLDTKPLTVNQVWQGKRFKTKKYKEYEQEVMILLPRGQEKPQGRLRVEYRFYLKHHSTTDYDNLIKPLQDILCKASIIEDDRFIYEATIKKIQSERDYVEIQISTI